MQKTITFEGGFELVTLSNLGDFDNLGFSADDLNEEADIEAIMQEVNNTAESGELESCNNTLHFKLINPENIEYLGIEDEEGNVKELTLDAFTLKNENAGHLASFLENVQEQELIYLRREKGNGSCILNLECENEGEEMLLSYYDCATELDEYDILKESYFDAVCDMILPESLRTQNNNAVVENFVFEPRMVYGELYRVINNEGVKTFERIPMPGYYFQEELQEEEI